MKWLEKQWLEMDIIILINLFIYFLKISTSSPPPCYLPLPTSPSLSSPKSTQGSLPLGKSKVLPPPFRSIKVSIQTDQDPKKPGHADETRPSAIVNGFSVNPHVSRIQRIRFDHMLVQSQFSWPW